MKGYTLHKGSAQPGENIREKFAYLYNPVGYPNSSDINELCDIPPAVAWKNHLILWR